MKTAILAMAGAFAVLALSACAHNKPYEPSDRILEAEKKQEREALARELDVLNSPIGW